MKITIEGKQGEGKTRMANAIENIAKDLFKERKVHNFDDVKNFKENYHKIKTICYGKKNQIAIITKQGV